MVIHAFVLFPIRGSIWICFPPDFLMREGYTSPAPWNQELTKFQGF